MVDNFLHQALRDYYEKWYRDDVGDVGGVNGHNVSVHLLAPGLLEVIAPGKELALAVAQARRLLDRKSTR